VVAVDPLASLSVREIWVTVAGKEYRMEGRPAIDWLDTLISGDWVTIIPGWFAADDEDEVLALLADDLIDVKDLDETTKDALTVAAGRPWWWALSLIGYASSDIHHWSRVNGRLMLAGVDASKISLSAWVDAVYAVHIEHMDDNDEYTKFKMEIDTPPTPDLLDEEAEAAALLSMMG